MNINIEAATISDLPLVSDLAYRIWPSTFGLILSPEQISYMLQKMYALSSLRHQLEEQHHRFFLAKNGEEPIGFVSYELNYKGSGSCKIHKLYLLPETQGTGSGRLLLDWVKNEAILYRQDRLTLNVNRQNKATGFYKHYGFDIVLEEDIDIGQGYFMNDFVMEMPLKPSSGDALPHS